MFFSTGSKDIELGVLPWEEDLISKIIISDIGLYLIANYGVVINYKNSNFYTRIENLMKHDFLIVCKSVKNWKLLLRNNTLLQKNFYNKYSNAVKDESIFDTYIPLSIINIDNKLKFKIKVKLTTMNNIVEGADAPDQLAIINIEYTFKVICKSGSLVCCYNKN